MDNTTALDAAVDALDAHAATRDASIGGFLAAREGSASWLAGRHDDLDLVERERQEAQILKQPTARLSRSRGGSPEDAVTQFVQDRGDLWDLTLRDAATVEVVSVSRKGLNTVNLIQHIEGKEVFNSDVTAACFYCLLDECRALLWPQSRFH